MGGIKKQKTSARPLIPGGNNYTAMHLSFQPQVITVKPSLWCYFFAALMILPGLGFFIFPILMFKLLSETDLLLLGISAAVFVCGGFLVFCAFRMVQRISKRCRSRFDLSTRIFYPCGCRLREMNQENFPAIAFSELDSLQIVEEHCSSGKSNFDSYELNVVLRDGRRFNLLDHSNKECFAEEAEKLSEILSIPLTDAHGYRLSCDSLLSLPSNIRENLLYGLYAFLFFVLLFAFGDGRAWYLTSQSFQWDKTPAYVDSAKIRKHSGRHTSYSLDFRFRYCYNGKIFNGNEYNFFNMRTSKYTLEEITRRYPHGKKFFCYVNPRTPKLAVVDRNIPPVLEMLLHSPWTSCFLIVGIFCMLKATMQYRLLKKRSRRTQITG